MRISLKEPPQGWIVDPTVHMNTMDLRSICRNYYWTGLTSHTFTLVDDF